MATTPQEMRRFPRRLASFREPHPVGPRASSSSRKKAANTTEWPHARPEPEALARAGFFYRPATDSADNVQCFCCAVKLDGWEESDDAIQEHLAHTDYCDWATVISVRREDDDERDPEIRDPMSVEMTAARTGTFMHGYGWPHEHKKGWKCKISKLVDAGWSWDPHAEGEEGDGVSCFYCNMSLDGWEPKDDPFMEHKRRAPNCRFFQLLREYHGADAANGKMKKIKGQAKAGTRTSTASKASRMSTQSAMSDMPSMAGSLADTLDNGSLAGVDDSILTTATNASQAITKGIKKGGRTRATGKAKKGKKDAQVESEMDVDQAPPEEEESHKRAAKRARTSKQVDSSMVELSHFDAAPPNKTRGRKPNAQAQPDPQPQVVHQTPEPEVDAGPRMSEVSAQLHEELDHTAPLDQSTPVIEQPKPKRGIKRTSDGLRKDTQIDSSAVEVDDPVPAKAPPPKRGRGRPKKISTESTDAEKDMRSSDVVPTEQLEAMGVEQSQVETIQAAPATKKGKGKAKAKGKGKKTSSTRSSKAALATAEPEAAETDEHEDLERDEIEIEAELQRIAAEQASEQAAMQNEQEQVDEFEPSPSQGRVSKDSAEIQGMRDEVQAEDENISRKDFVSPWKEPAAGPTPSPSGSEKENRPFTASRHSSEKQKSAAKLSPTKTVRIPIAASTPHRSPGKRMLSPSKQISHLHSSAPWSAVDLDTALLPSPQPTPGKLEEQLVAAAGNLTEEEKKMSVEEFVRHRAGRAEEQLRKGCERLVAAFEKEGMRGLESLNGIQIAG
ncbi:Hypothetical predicted protein [Lecanosticta acicola]|uniref:BIR-domain-containing protein n=1 Tax=Lecanosticta acicola TaxID=111012 RepID=A0AAI8W213_9PEZI|nr:Hypothetical predicted protein [Lecanosticta acicola]